MVTVLIDGLPTDWECADIYLLLHPYCPSHVYIAADHCGTSLGFVFVFFSNEGSATKALTALLTCDVSGKRLYVRRIIAPRVPGEVTG
jgi:hypothetical protein